MAEVALAHFAVQAEATEDAYKITDVWGKWPHLPEQYRTSVIEYDAFDGDDSEDDEMHR